ncbi:EF-hand domain-containing protein [Nocardia thailandica]|uniref:EF-hand domain-containing protein n=1 Tax=Nocardia thailandica TaxID=257275 RepID=UPI0014616CC3|nr:EF-hand domain-containing protein [Nocardia thailandica]
MSITSGVAPAEAPRRRATRPPTELPTSGGGDSGAFVLLVCKDFRARRCLSDQESMSRGYVMTIPEDALASDLDADDGTAWRRSDGDYLFVACDSDSDGLISAADLLRTVTSWGLTLGEAEAAEFVAAGDTDGDGLISLTEFDAVRARVRVEDGNSAVEDAFYALDTDGDQAVSVEELTAIASRLGEFYTTGQARDLIAPFDVDGDGKLALDEFVTLFTCLVGELEPDAEAAA